MHKIITFTEVETIIADFRKKSSVRIVFTNGCFDLIHRGHVEYLEKARSFGDLLVLGLNSDESVRRLKGANRPLMNEEDRAFVLSRLEAVDMVCIFDQDTPFELIKKVRPDVLVKGGDYKLDEIVGRDLVEADGGKVITIPLVEGRSTSTLIEKIRKGINEDVI